MDSPGLLMPAAAPVMETGSFWEHLIELCFVLLCRNANLPAEPEEEPPVLPKGGALRGLMSWTGSLGAGSDGVDSISKNFTNISEKDCGGEGAGRIGV